MSRTTELGGRSFSRLARAETSLTEIHHLRLAMIRDGAWPLDTADDWHQRARIAVASGDVSGPAVRAIETSRALREAEARRQGSAA